MPEIVVAARMMIKTEIKPRVRVLVNLSSLSEILRSACHQMSTDEVLIAERGERRDTRYLGAAIFLLSGATAEDTHRRLLGLRTVEA